MYIDYDLSTYISECLGTFSKCACQSRVLAYGRTSRDAFALRENLCADTLATDAACPLVVTYRNEQLDQIRNAYICYDICTYLLSTAKLAMTG